MRDEVADVRRFVAALGDIRARLFRDLAPVADVAGLLAAVRATRELPRSGSTISGLEYRVHGAGCRMTASDGRQVDVDLVRDPVTGEWAEVFDGWRVHWFLGEAVSGAQRAARLTAACGELARRGELREVVPERWFALLECRTVDGDGGSGDGFRLPGLWK
ncbi:DUF6896 domain-containing protein [Actinoplanes sp. NPDC048796]|uniref:DUF6896 domain-containing protein n=1 Tax=unclassified Actinoplanes TaxID=2626549 RepID=UPI0033C4AC21